MSSFITTAKTKAFAEVQLAEKSTALTDRRLQWVVSLAAPPRWVYVGAIIVHPVVIDVAPSVKMEEHPVSINVLDRSDSDENGVPLVHSLHLHTNLKTMVRSLQPMESIV